MTDVPSDWVGIDGGYYGIFDGIIIWEKPDGTLINRFAGTDTPREATIDNLIRHLNHGPAEMTCGTCGKEREDDTPDFHPSQLLYDRPVGWYDGKDGVLCGDCMSRLFKMANGPSND